MVGKYPVPQGSERENMLTTTGAGVVVEASNVIAAANGLARLGNPKWW